MPQTTSKPSKAAAGTEKAKGFWQNGPFNFNADSFLRRNQENIEACSQSGSNLFKNSMEINHEIMNFVSKRLQQDMDTVSALATCKTPEDAFKVQTNFLEEAIRQYADESAKILKMSADAATNMLTPLEERTADALHSLNSDEAEAEKPS